MLRLRFYFTAAESSSVTVAKMYSLSTEMCGRFLFVDQKNIFNFCLIKWPQAIQVINIEFDIVLTISYENPHDITITRSHQSRFDKVTLLFFRSLLKQIFGNLITNKLQSCCQLSARCARKCRAASLRWVKRLQKWQSRNGKQPKWKQ